MTTDHTREAPARPCEESDLLRDYVGDGREYRGHNGSCMNCDAEYSEADDGDLSSAHWIHTIQSHRAHWEATTPDDVKALALTMDPDVEGATPRAPYTATEHAVAILASPWLAAHVAAAVDVAVASERERIGAAIEADGAKRFDPDSWRRDDYDDVYAKATEAAARIARSTTDGGDTRG